MNALGAFLGAEKIRTVGIASADSVDPRLTLRFLLTFDDGPHSHTGQVLRHLARNPVATGHQSDFLRADERSQEGRLI